MGKETSHLLNIKEPAAQINKYGMTVFVTALYAVGEQTGSGVLAQPKAMTQLGWIGFIVLAAVGVVVTYTSSLLSRCLMIVQQRYVEYQDHPRYPYPAIGMVTFGKPGRLFVSCCSNVTMFGGAVVYLLLSAENIQDLISYFDDSISLCWWLLIIASVLWPLTWFGTPKDFWPIGVVAAVVILVAGWLIIAVVILDAEQALPPYYDPITITGFLTGLGTILFGHGGHASFPNIQVDMKEPHKFLLAMKISFIIMFFTYGSVSLAGYLVYGSALDDNILDTISSGTLSILAQVFLTLHFVSGFDLQINPVCQEGEDVLGIPKNFGYQRVIFRTFVVILVWFTAASVPQFSFIISLVGGTTITALSIVGPPIFYLKLCSMKGDWDQIEVPLHEKVACIQVIVIGIGIVIAITYTSVIAVMSSDFSKPCYLS